PGQPFVDAYVNFVEHVRTKYPAAYIFCLIQATDSDVNIDKVVAMMKSSGDEAIESFDINVTDGGNGCDYHPDTAKDQAMGAKLAGELKTVLGWCRPRRPPVSAVKHGLDVVPVEIEHERAVVVRVIVGAHAGRAVVLAARLERRAVKRVDFRAAP